MKARGFAITLCVAAFAVLASGCVATEPIAGDPTTALLQSRCTVCHGIERINGARHDRAGWQETIARMRGKGAQVSDTEVATLVDYLTNRQVPLPSTPATVSGPPTSTIP
jgi:hypothetical protein